MDQFQWMLSLIPDAILSWIYWLIIAAGISGVAAGWLGKWIPLYGKYVQFLKPAGVVLLVLGVWLRGGYDTEMRWRAKVEEAQAKIAIAEAASNDLNTKIATVTKQKQKVRTEYITTVKERIVEKQVQIDAKCELDPTVPQILNDAAKNTAKKGTVTIQEVKQ
jgi:hypothetical protein